ncbi:MAG TPA: MFS transporter, partial [Thalassospira sp.]|nr:MFS transporter [Thalassospira sp.]
MSKDLQPETSTHAAPIEVPGNPDLSGGAVAHKGWRNPEVLLIFMAA